MSDPISRRRLAIATLAFPFLWQALALGELSIRLTGVPERLSLPLPEGVNQVLTATIKGGEVGSVWLAPSATTSSPSRRVMLTKVDDGEYGVNLAGRELYDLLKPHGADGEFRVFAETAEGRTAQSISVRYTICIVPERLDFPWDEAKMTVYQRASKKLPCSDGSLRVHLGDITAGQVLVSIFGPNDEPMIDTTPMQEGDTLPLSLAEQDYVLRLDRLVNLLVGHDYGVFSLMGLHAWEAQKIDRLLDVIATSGLTFIRNDGELSSQVFAAHLRRKYEYYGLRNASLAEFIEKVASCSSTTAKPYRVKLPAGDIVDADTWLREQAAKIVRKPKEEDGPRAQESEEAPPKPGC